MADERGRVKPKYRQIADDMRAAIDAGKYRPGDQVPSLDELAESYGVAVNTADHAVDVLRKEGRVYTMHGSGTWVAEPGEPSPDFTAVMKEMREMRGEFRLLAERVAELERERQRGQ
jgi:GntR family transcriptional regulator